LSGSFVDARVRTGGSDQKLLSNYAVVSGYRTLLANRDARTQINCFQIYGLEMRAQIGPVMSKITGQTL
jgi:hypothetical protein